MQPYLIEGLDCSAKKTIAASVHKELERQGIGVRVVIGPLVQGPIGRLDARLANLTRPVAANSPLGLFRRLVYTLGPVLDGIAYAPPPDPTIVIKVSSHYRAWARALLVGDSAMHRFYRATSLLHPTFAGATLLTTDFEERVRRHRRDAAAGRTTKNERVRFLGGALYFAAWHHILNDLVQQHVGNVHHLDTTAADTEDLVQQVIGHITSCWEHTR